VTAIPLPMEMRETEDAIGCRAVFRSRGRIRSFNRIVPHCAPSRRALSRKAFSHRAMNHRALEIQGVHSKGAELYELQGVESQGVAFRAFRRWAPICRSVSSKEGASSREVRRALSNRVLNYRALSRRAFCHGAQSNRAPSH